MSKYNLTLAHAPNGDLAHVGGYWNRPIDPPVIYVPCDSIADAVNKFNEWRDKNGLGGGNMVKETGILTTNRAIAARISYNGKIWKGAASETQTIVAELREQMETARKAHKEARTRTGQDIALRTMTWVKETALDLEIWNQI